MLEHWGALLVACPAALEELLAWAGRGADIDAPLLEVPLPYVPRHTRAGTESPVLQRIGLLAACALGEHASLALQGVWGRGWGRRGAAQPAACITRGASLWMGAFKQPAQPSLDL